MGRCRFDQSCVWCFERKVKKRCLRRHGVSIVDALHATARRENIGARRREMGNHPSAHQPLERATSHAGNGLRLSVRSTVRSSLSLPLSPSLLPSPLPFDAFSRVNERSCRTCLVQLLQTTARTTLNLLPFQLYCFLDYVPKLYASVFYCLTTVLFFRCKRHRIFPPSRSRYFCSIYSIASISIFDNNHRLRGKFTVP